MKFVLFYHSMTSDWNHGNAHFLRGITSELLGRGHSVDVYEPADGWSLTQLLEHEGRAPVERFRQRYPRLSPRRYLLDELDLDEVLDGADVVIVHEWNPPELPARLGAHRSRTHSGYLLLFHDTHHRAVSAPEQLSVYPLENFDGTLAFGEAVAEVYRQRGWGHRVWVWHEAADTRVFRPPEAACDPEGDVVWIGNWGDDERAGELEAFLLRPARQLGLTGAIYGVRYPDDALRQIEESGLAYRGWLANFDAPEAFHRHRFTVHVPRRFYRCELPGIPTIRVFEALACGIPLISAPWFDCERLFKPGRDFLMVDDPDEMREAMRAVLHDPAMARELAQAGRATIERRHSCAHRVDELLEICRELQRAPAEAAS